MNELAGLTVDFDTSSVNPATRDVDAFNKTAQRTESVMRAIEASARRSGISFDEAARRYDKATQSLGKNSDAANKAANDNSKIAGVLRQAEGSLQNYASRLGTVGSALSTLGPIALGITATLGAMAAAFIAASHAALELADKAGQLKDFADTTGFSVTQLQALQKAAAQVGVNSNAVARGLERFSVQMDDIKKGVGPVYEQLLEINPVLAQQMTQVKSAAEAWDVFSKAVKQADLENANKLARAAFGRGGIELTRLMRASADAGGISGLVKQIKEVNLITAEQADKWDQLGDTIAENMRQAKQNVVATFAEPTLEALKTLTDAIRVASEMLKSFQMSDDLKRFFGYLLQVVPVIGPLATLMKGIQTTVSNFAPPDTRGLGREAFDSRFGGLPTSAPPTMDEAKRTAALEAEKAALSKVIAERERYAAVAGAAVTPLQQLQLQIDKITLAEKQNQISAQQAAQARAELNRQFNNQQFAQYVGLLGQSASVADQVKLKENELNDARARGIRLTTEQRDNIIRVAREEANGVLAVRAMTDAVRIESETFNMTTGQAQAYSIVQNRIAEARRRGQPLAEEDIKNLQREAQEYANAVDAAQRMRELRQTALGFTQDFVSGLMQGQSAMSALGNAARNLSNQLANSALSSLFSGNFAMAAVQGVGALVSGIFGRNQQRRDEERRQAEETMRQAMQTIQQNQFRAALAGIDTSTREGSLREQELRFQQERLAVAGQGAAAMQSLEIAQQAERLRLMQDWNEREKELEKQRNDELERIAKEALKRQMQWRDALFGLLNDTDTLQGALAAIDREWQQKAEEEREAGGQASVDLDNYYMNKRLRTIKDFQERAIQAEKEAQAERERIINGAASNILNYVNGLMTGSQAGLSPQARFNAAQAQYQAQLSLAQGGNLDAQNKISQSFEEFRQAARDLYGSTQAYQDILTAGINQLLALSAVQDTTDPLLKAMRDVLSAVQTGNQTVTTTGANTVAAVNTNTNSTNATVSQRSAEEQAFLALQNSIAQTNLTYAITTNNLLEAIRSLTDTNRQHLSVSQEHLQLMREQLTGSATIGASGPGGGITIQNNMLTALNKIVANTYAIAFNTWSVNVGEFRESAIQGVYAQGGLVGGQPHASGGTRIEAELGEYVINKNSVASIGTRALDHMNDAGRVPMIQVASNDNSAGLARRVDVLAAAIDRMADMIVEATDRNTTRITTRLDKNNDTQSEIVKVARRRG